jgi:hypothetical protein
VGICFVGAPQKIRRQNAAVHFTCFAVSAQDWDYNKDLMIQSMSRNMERIRSSIPLDERGKYYRGLLVLIRRDRNISPQERELMMQLGQALDFDLRFCENTINELLDNPHIKAEPITFSNQETARFFIQDAILIALSDGKLHPKELSWLKIVASANGLDNKWLSSEIAGAVQR